MQDLSALPVSVAVATQVSTPTLVDRLSLTSEDLSSLFAAARASSVHTQPPPSNQKDMKKALERIHTFSAAHLNAFLYGYLFGRSPLSEEALSGILSLAVNAGGEWAHACQSLALRLLLAELEARNAGVVPRAKPDDPSLLAQLRHAFPEFRGNAPSASMSACHFTFVGPLDGALPYAAEVTLRNDGAARFTVRVCQTHTVIDGVVAHGDFFHAPLAAEGVVRAGETAHFRFSLRSLPSPGASGLEQVIVLSVDEYVKLFVTFSVLSPRQRPFRVGFPRCLALAVRDSPLGAYASPMMLQLLKHQFIRQQGLASREAAHLLLGKATNYAGRNREVMREATRVREVLEEEMDFGEALATYWSALPPRAGGGRDLPPSSAQPAGYTPGGTLPTAVADVSRMSCFPNAATRLPPALGTAAPDVLLGLILIWLAELDAAVFDAAVMTTEPMAYLEALPPHLQGVVFWVIDLCVGFLMHKETNGLSLRYLALTFAAVLVRKRGRMPSSSNVFAETEAVALLDRETVMMDMALQQAAVTAFVHWITVCLPCYVKYYCS